MVHVFVIVEGMVSVLEEDRVGHRQRYRQSKQHVKMAGLSSRWNEMLNEYTSDHPGAQRQVGTRWKDPFKKYRWLV